MGFTPLQEEPKATGGRGFVPLAETPAPKPSEGLISKALRFLGGGEPVQTVGAQRLARLEAAPPPVLDPNAGVMADYRDTAPNAVRRSDNAIAAIADQVAPSDQSYRPGAEPMLRPEDVTQSVSARSPVLAALDSIRENPVGGGIVGGLAQGGQVIPGAVRAGADLLGLDSVADFAGGAGRIAEGVNTMTTPENPGLDRNIRNAIASTVVSAPSAFAGKAWAAQLAAQTAPVEYQQGREGGLDPLAAAVRAVPMTAAEVGGEKIGGGAKIAEAMRMIGRPNAPAIIARNMGEAALQNIPGELATFAGQTATDALPGIGLNPDITVPQILSGIKETAAVAGLQSALMAGAGSIAKARAADRRDSAAPAPYTPPIGPVARPEPTTATEDARSKPIAPNGFTPIAAVPTQSAAASLQGAIEAAFPTIPKEGMIEPNSGAAPVLNPATNDADLRADVNKAPETTPLLTPEAPAITLQNRDRSSAASIAQMNAIAADPDAARLSFSREFASGAPVVFGNQDAAQIPQTQVGRSDVITDANGKKYEITYAVVDAREITPSNRVDGSSVPEYLDNDTPGRIRAIAGNGRLAGLQAAFDRGTAAKYVEGIAADAALHGIAPEAIAGIERPALVRLMKSADVNGQIGDLSNQSGVSALNASEQARTDSERVDFDALEFDEAGNPTAQAVTRFVQNMPAAEQGALMVNKGAPSKQASERLMAATFNRAYGDPALVELHAQATDPEARIVLSGLAQAAASMQRLEGAGALDIRPLIVEAAQAAVNAARRGIPLSKLAQQQDMQMAPAAYEFIRYFAANYRSAKRIGEKLREIADFAYTEANKSDVDMFGAVQKATPADVIGKLKDETSSAQVMEQRGGYATAPDAVARTGEGSRANNGAVSQGAQSRGSAETEGELTLAEVEAIQDIPTVEKMREAVATVGEQEFRRRVNEQTRALYYKKDGTPFGGKEPGQHQRALAVEAVAIKIVALNRRNRAAEPDDLLSTYTPDEIRQREQAREDAARREKAPPPETFELESQDERSESKQAEDAGQERLFQRDLFGADLPEQGRLTDPGTDTERRGDKPGQDRASAGDAGNANRGTGLLRKKSTVVAKPIPGAKKPRPSVLAKSIADEFEQGEPAQLIGREVAGPHDVALLAQIYRDPRYETFRMFFTKGNKIVDATAVTSRLPGQTSAFVGNNRAEFVQNMQNRMRATGADGYYLLHNHPSGDPTASGADKALTANFSSELPGFKAHIIVNSGKYGVMVDITVDAELGDEIVTSTHELPNAGPDALHTAAKPSPYLGVQIDSPGKVAHIGKMIQKRGYVAMIGVHGSKVRTLAEMPLDLLDNPTRAAAWIRRLAVGGGSGQDMFLSFESNADIDRHIDTLFKLKNAGFITDAVNHGGDTSIARIDGVSANRGAFGRDSRHTRDLGEPSARERARWRDVKYNDVGPIYFGDGYYLDALAEIKVTGNDLTHGLPMGHATSVDKDNQVLAFTIRNYKGEDLGYAALQITPEGEVAALHDIEVKGKQKGLGRRVVAGIVASTNKPVKIVQIVPSAEAFWDKVGTGTIDPYGNSEISWPTFARSARRSAGRVAPQDISTEAAEPGRSGARDGTDRVREEVTPYPPRTADTMSDAISQSSPNGRVSKRTKEAADERLRVKLFGENGLQKPDVAQPSERETLLRQAKELRELAARGMSPKKYNKQADALEAEADALIAREPSSPYGEPTGLARIIDPMTHRLKAGEKAYAALEKYIGKMMLAKIGLASNAPPSFKRLLQQFRGEKGKAAEAARTVAEAGESLPPAERTLLSDYVEQEMRAGVVPPQHIVDVAKTMDAALVEQTKTLVELGMLSKETAERWSGRYLPRYYSKDLSNTLMGRLFRIGIRGNHMKARGVFDTVPLDQLEHWKAMGFEVREFYESENPGFVTVWRDWTKQERESMGEIRDGVYRFARGMMETGSDIASAKLFQAIGKSEFATRNRAMALQKGWKKVPDDEIEGTQLKKYGALAKMYVDPAIWKELSFEFRDKGAFERSLASLTALWKEGKTAMNPSTHAANVVSSIVMADFAGISPLNVKAYISALRDFLHDGPATKKAIDIGLLGGEAIHEIKQWLPDPGSLAAANTPGAIAAAFNSKAALMLGKFSGASFYRENMRKLYGAEDAFFKVLIFKHYTDKGMLPEQAMEEANRYIFDYRDLPPLAQRIRDSAIGIPFISYTYKAIPAVAHSILTRPWVVAKYAALFNGINALAFAMGGDGDEENERKNMPQHMKGWTPLFYPTHVRLMNDAAGDPQYLNVGRLSPLGTLFAPMNGEGVPMLQSFAPNHPIYNMILTLGFNRDAFTGRDFFKPSDDVEDRVKKGSKYVYQQLMPSTPVLPGSHAWDKVMNGVSEAIDRPIDLPTGSYTGKSQGRSGREETLPKAIGQTVLGINVRAFNPGEQEGFKRRDAMREMGEIRANIRRHSTNQGISDETRQARIATEKAKLDKIRERARP